jgi:Cu(I)/Ag(I) efflux system membrane protein CusA/SilA
MIAAIIRASVRGRFLVLLAAVALLVAGVIAVRSTPVDALPDLSDVQVVIRTTYPGQAPQIVENQVTYPLTTTMLSVPGAKTVRGYSFFGDSFVYVLFEDGTDLYWARSRVLEYLNQVQSRLPTSARPSLGPDATGVGWIYEYALVDRSGRHDLSQLRGLQDWFLRYELKTVPGVAEVASVGGMVRQYQVVLDPVRLAGYRVTHQQAVEAIRRANQEAGGSVLEMGEAEYMVRASGYLKTLGDFRAIPLRTAAGGVPVRLGDVATVQLGPEMRRGIAELNGEGEVAGGVVILRSDKNARETLAAVKDKVAELKRSLPAGVEMVTTYDRSQLIDRAIANLTQKLAEEFVVVALVCALFLWHARSALVAVITLPLGVLFAFLVMRAQGVNANIMSLGGIAIAIGAMVDAAVVMIENAHKRLERWADEHPGEEMTGDTRWRVITEAAGEVGPALFLSLVIITLSFVPVFALQAQEGRLFSPLAFTKSYAMAGAAILSVTLVPGPHPRRGRQSGEPLADRRLPPRHRLGAAEAAHGPRHRPLGLRHHGLAAEPLGRGVHSADGRGRPALHAVRPARHIGGQGLGAAPADRPPDPHRPRGEERVRQGRPRGNRDGSGPAGDVRDHYPAQAARPVAARHDPGEADRGAGPCGESPRSGQRLGSADPQPHRHAGHRHQEPRRGEGVRDRPGPARPCGCTGRGGREEDAWRQLGAR